MRDQVLTGEVPRKGGDRAVRVVLMLLVPVLVLGERYQQLHEPLRWRTALLVASAGCVVALAVRWRDLSNAWRTVIAAMVLSLLLAVVAVNSDSATRFYDASKLLFPVLLGWMVALLLTREDDAEPKGFSPRLSTAAIVTGLGVLAIVATVAAAQLGGGSWITIDEVLYLMQAERFAHGAVIQPVEPSLLPFFLPNLALPVPGGFVPHFPPGWPAMLALFSVGGVREWSMPILTAGTVIGVFLLGKRLHSKEAGALGALLLVLHSWFVGQGASYLSHMATMLLLVWSALLLQQTIGDEKVAARAVAAGFLMGWAVAARPLTGVALGTSIFLWCTLASGANWIRAARIAAFAALGAVVPLAGLLAYNAFVTGNPLQFGYTALHGSLHSLGFGERGYVSFDSSLQPVTISSAFTPGMAFDNLVQRVWSHAQALLPLFLFLPLLTMARVSGVGPQVRTVAVFLILPFCLFFFFEPVLRLYAELLPFIFAGVGVLAVRLHAARRLALTSMGALLIVHGLTSALALQRGYARQRDGFAGNGFRFMDEVKDVQERRGPILVFVREPFESEWWLSSLNYYNVDGYTGDIVVARDLGAENARLMRALPNHTPFLLRRETKSGEPPLVELDRQTAPAATTRGPGS